MSMSGFTEFAFFQFSADVTQSEIILFSVSFIYIVEQKNALILFRSAITADNTLTKIKAVNQ